MTWKKLYRLASGAVLAFGVHSAEAAPVTVGDVQSMKERAQAGAFSARAEWNALSFYLQGAMEAVALAQKDLETRNQMPLFCPPSGGSMDLADIFVILDDVPKHANGEPALDVILKDFKARYPCKG